MNIPAVGTHITVEMDNPSIRNAWDPATVKFSGAVAPTFRWLDADWFCLTTGDVQFPIRSIRKQRVRMITVGNTTITQSAQAQPQIKSGVWQVKGSKGNLYTVTRNGDRWGCDCPAGNFGRHICKHIKSQQAKEAA